MLARLARMLRGGAAQVAGSESVQNAARDARSPTSVSESSSRSSSRSVHLDMPASPRLTRAAAAAAQETSTPAPRQTDVQATLGKRVRDEKEEPEAAARHKGGRRGGGGRSPVATKPFKSKAASGLAPGGERAESKAQILQRIRAMGTLSGSFMQIL